MISHTVPNMPSIPPPDSNSSMRATPVSAVNPVAIACQMPLSITQGVARPDSSPTKCSTAFGCRMAASRPPVMAPARIAMTGWTFRTASPITTTSGIIVRMPVLNS